MQWSHAELRPIAIWHLAHAYELDDGDWTVTITADGIECTRDAHEGPEAEEAREVGREMMLQYWGERGPWLVGRIVVRRHADVHEKDWRPDK
jgi:hypothetical protein